MRSPPIPANVAAEMHQLRERFEKLPLEAQARLLVQMDAELNYQEGFVHGTKAAAASAVVPVSRAANLEEALTEAIRFLRLYALKDDELNTVIDRLLAVRDGSSTPATNQAPPAEPPPCEHKSWYSGEAAFGPTSSPYYLVLCRDCGAGGTISHHDKHALVGHPDWHASQRPDLCPSCHGMGGYETPDSKPYWVVCKLCHGDGIVHPPPPAEPVVFMSKCPGCRALTKCRPQAPASLRRRGSRPASIASRCTS
jgi:hypothetical protein